MSWTRKELSVAAVKRYIESEGAHCPYCGSTDIEPGRIQAEGSKATGDVECFACHARWRDLYTLSAVDAIAGDRRLRQTVTPANGVTIAPPTLDELFAAIGAHAADAHDPNFAAADLQEIVRAAWRVMTPAQRTTLMREREFAALATLREHEPMIGGLAR